jgi:hypothetical protein
MRLRELMSDTPPALPRFTSRPENRFATSRERANQSQAQNHGRAVCVIDSSETRDRLEPWARIRPAGLTMSGPLDSRTAACVSTAWIILANKPFYPLTVWVLVGAHAAALTLATLAFAPFYGLIPYLAKRSAWGARLALPVIGLGDTIYATRLLGAGAGAELFLFPCALLAIVGFSAKDAIASRALVVVIFCVYLGLHGRYGAPLQDWIAAEQAGLFSLNAFSAASLTAFIGLRFATAK